LIAESYEMQAQGLEQGGEAATGSRYPWLTALAGYRYGNPGLNQSADEWMGYGLVGLQLQWNLFDGFERRATRARFHADARALQAEAQRARTLQSAALATLEAERRSANAEAEALAAGVEASRAALHSLRNAEQGGVAIADDLLEAQDRLLELETRLDQWGLRNQLRELRYRWQAGEPIGWSAEEVPQQQRVDEMTQQQRAEAAAAHGTPIPTEAQ
jgi:outer membrane protein TolC